MNTPHLSCMNCKTPVSERDGEFFAEVFLCPTCKSQAVHFWERLERELKHTLLIAKESIRLALIQGNFHFPEGAAGEPSKREVLEEILRMHEAKEAAQEKENSCQSTGSGDATPPHVRTLAALGASPSSKPSPQD